MTMPKAYEPFQDQMFQFLLWDEFNREYDHLDYAEDKEEKKHLLTEYRLVYSGGQRIKVITLPQKYWKKKEKDGNEKMVSTVNHMRFEKFEKSNTINVYAEDEEIYCYTNYGIGSDMEKFRESNKGVYEYLMSQDAVY